MTDRQAIVPPGMEAVYEQIGYAPAIRVGNTVYVSGQIGRRRDLQLVEDREAQITEAFANLQLVLEAGSIAKGGEIFVLNMGEPVKIIDLAEKMIRLTGLEPYLDIPIVFSGLRPGEKLYEELSYNLKSFDSTKHEDIFVENIWPFDKDWIDQELGRLKYCAETGSDEDVIQQLKSLVPDYLPNRNSQVTIEKALEIEKSQRRDL